MFRKIKKIRKNKFNNHNNHYKKINLKLNIGFDIYK
jgi:hypothetical protein